MAHELLWSAKKVAEAECHLNPVDDISVFIKCKKVVVTMSQFSGRERNVVTVKLRNFESDGSKTQPNKKTKKNPKVCIVDEMCSFFLSFFLSFSLSPSPISRSLLSLVPVSQRPRPDILLCQSLRLVSPSPDLRRTSG